MIYIGSVHNHHSLASGYDIHSLQTGEIHHAITVIGKPSLNRLGPFPMAMLVITRW